LSPPGSLVASAGVELEAVFDVPDVKSVLLAALADLAEAF
jgi:hypothetical protein